MNSDRLLSVTLPLPDDLETVELVRELLYVACTQRALLELAGGNVRVHFRLVDDAISFFDLIASMLDRTSVGISPAHHPQVLRRPTSTASADRVEHKISRYLTFGSRFRFLP